MLDVVDTAHKAFPQVTSCVVVNDIAAEMADEDEDKVVSDLSKSLLSICWRLTADGLEISETKSVATVWLQAIGERLPTNLAGFGGQVHKAS